MTLTVLSYIIISKVSYRTFTSFLLRSLDKIIVKDYKQKYRIIV